MYIRKFAFALLLLCAFTVIGCVGFAEVTRYDISSEQDLSTAVQAINAAGSGEYELCLQDDIQVNSGNLSLNSATTVTILGEGHTLKFNAGGLMVSGNTVLNLGRKGYAKSLTLTKAESVTFETLISVYGSGTMNMYDGVLLCDSITLSMAGAVSMGGKAAFNMYGGRIYNCHSPVSVAGGVVLDDNSSFVMEGGAIEGCSGVQGGAVGVYGGRFVMNGGEIIDCTDDYFGGGGVYVYAWAPVIGVDGQEQCAFEMNGGRITGCSAPSYGGGVMAYVGDVSIGPKAKVYDNRSDGAGDDVFSYGGGYSTVQLSNVPSGMKLSDCGHAVDGWYLDGILNGEINARWNAVATEIDEVFVEAFTPDAEPFTGMVALKAAHSLDVFNEDDEDEAVVPETGDGANLILWIGMLLASTVCVWNFSRRAKREY